MPTVDANGIEIYYERWGEGPPLLFFNGSGTTLATTKMMLDPYAARFELLAHDQRGLGRTSIPPGPYEMADYAADGAALLDHVGWERCRVAGVSFGGMVAQEFAVTFPERVERPPANGEAIAARVPGADLRMYEGGHMFFVQDPTALPDILDFLAR